MSKKKKRIKNQDKALQKAKAIIRGERDLEVGISNLKASYSTKQILEIIPKLLKHPAYNTIIANKPFPKTFGLTGPLRFSKVTSLNKEIAWLSAMFVNFSEQIQFYLSTVSQSESQYLMGDQAGCLESLNLIKEKLGVSINLFERELQLEYHFGSYVEKDKLIKSVKSIKKGAFINYAFVWTNLRIDRTMRPEEFTRLISESLSSDHHVNGLFRLLQGQIYKTDAITSAKILSTSHTFPILDRYEMFIELLAEIISAKSFELSPESIQCLVHIEQNINDIRLQKLLISLGITPKNNIKNDKLDSTAVMIKKFSEFIMIREPISSELDEALLVNSTEKLSLIDEIQLNLKLATEYSSKSYAARNTLLNLCSIHSNHGWASNLLILLEHQLNNTFIFSPTATQLKALIKATLDIPLFAFCFSHKKSKVTYLDLFRRNDSHSNMVGIIDDISSNTIDKSSYSTDPIFTASRHLNNNYPEKAEAVLKEHANSSFSFSQQNEIRTILVRHLLQNNKLKLAIIEASKNIIRSNFFAYILPIKEIVVKLKIENYKPISESLTRGQISAAIIFDVYSRTVSTKFDVEKADTYKDILKFNKVEKASELTINNSNYTPAELYYFLKNVCILDVLDQSLLFTTTKDVENERVAILVKLNELKESFEKYDDAEIKGELTEISTRRVINQTAIQLENSKIYVNIEGIRRQLDSKLQDTWDRFKSVKIDDSEQMNSDLVGHLNKAFEHQLQFLILNQPITERRKLLESIIHTIISEFTLNKEFGLNSNLSANIRHGYVLGELRGPFVKNKLVTNKNTDSGTYQENKQLINDTENLDADDLDYLKSCLDIFSERIDDEIDNLNKNLLRIKTLDFPQGLFKYEINTRVIDTLFSTAEETEDFIKFSNVVYEFLWALTENNLNAVRETLSNQVATSMSKAVDDLRKGLEVKSIILRNPDVNSYLVNAKTELRRSIQSVSNWFTLSKVAEYKDFNIQLAYQAGLRTIKTYFFDTKIDASFTGDDFTLKGFTLPFFARLFFLLLDNACSHGAEQGKTLNIEVVSEVDGDQILLKIKNSLRSSRDLTKTKEIVEKINKEYSKSLGLDRIGEESGSGYPKIWNLLYNDLNLRHDLTVNLKDDDFIVEILIEGSQLL